MYTVRIVLFSVLPRVLLQLIFYSWLGRTVGGAEGESYAFVGGVVLILASCGIVLAPDVIVDDKWQHTLYQLRLGEPALLTVMLLRSWVYLAQGMVTSLIAILALGPLLTDGRTVWGLLVGWPALAVAGASSICLGMTLGAASLSRPVEVLLSNGMFYAVVLFSSAVSPLDDHPVLERIGDLLPAGHAVAFVRGYVAGTPPWPQLGLEALVGACWLAVAAVLLHVQTRRSAKTGTDSFD